MPFLRFSVRVGKYLKALQRLGASPSRSATHAQHHQAITTRGGVEDTRLEAKAKDTKKIRGQGQAFPRTDTLEAKDRNARGQGQGPRTQSASALQKKKKKRSSQKFFKRSPLKNVFQKIFQAFHKILTFQKIVLSSSRGQANFRGLEASRPRPRT